MLPKGPLQPKKGKTKDQSRKYRNNIFGSLSRSQRAGQNPEDPRAITKHGFHGVQWKTSTGRIFNNWKFSFTELKLDLR